MGLRNFEIARLVNLRIDSGGLSNISTFVKAISNFSISKLHAYAFSI
jgi:hypothetical protein